MKNTTEIPSRPLGTLILHEYQGAIAELVFHWYFYVMTSALAREYQRLSDADLSLIHI